jgi:CPA1 family monovalent cation:H+ antiporter
MTATIQTLLLMLIALVAVAFAARKLRTAPSILLVLVGIALAVTPGLPAIELAPEFVLLIILPPLIYSAGVSMSWREFKSNLRPIALLAVGCVVFTTCTVAVVAHYLFGLPWAVGFVLGAIVAPPDVVAPLAIARRLNLPRRLRVILEGEGLANDATALILYRFAVAAVATGSFSIGPALGTFSIIVIGEIIFGVGVGWLSLRLRRWVHDARAEITLSLATPYLAFWIPEHLGGSGVLATVACGLYVSWNGPLLIGSSTRLQGIFFWDLFIYLIEGFVFLITGLQANTVLARIQGYSLREIIAAIAITTLLLMITRFVWVFPATYLPRWFSPSLKRRDPSPPWKLPFMISFIGIRGIVSLAAALALPLALNNGDPFPGRDLILVITFGVIVATLVGLGLILPFVVRLVGLAGEGEKERQRELSDELVARLEAMQFGQRHLDEIAAQHELPEKVFSVLRNHYADRLQLLPRSFDDSFDEIVLGTSLRIQLISEERKYLHRLLREGRITDEARRRVERELDLEETTITTAMERDGSTPL